MEKKIKVLMVVFNLSVANGVSSYVMNYFRNLEHNKIIMDFVVYQDVETPYSKEIIDNGGHIFKVPSIKHLYSHMNTSKKIICQGQYDIVHDNILILSYFIMHYAKKYKVPVRILHSHNSRLGETKYKELRNKWLLPVLLNTANAYFACSDLAAQALFGKRPYVFVPNVISVKKFSFNESVRERVRNQFHCGNKFIIGTVGRLATQKNPFYAIDTIIKVYEHNSNIQYWWIGSGPLMGRVKAYIEEKNATSYIRLFGSRNDIADLYQAMDLFFLPSLFEGLPVTGVEAQAMGLPCLVSDNITSQFICTDLVSSLSIKQSDKKSAKTLMSFFSKKYERSQYADKLRKSCFSDQNAGEFLLKVYHQLRHDMINV